MPHNPFFPGTISNPVMSKINMSKRNASEVIVHKEPGLRCSLFNAVRKAGRCISLNKCLLAGCIQLDYQLFFAKDGQFVFTEAETVIQVGIA